jgi:hypothetical protein
LAMNFEEDQELASRINVQTNADKAEFGRCIYEDIKNNLYHMYFDMYHPVGQGTNGSDMVVGRKPTAVIDFRTL